MASTSNVTLDDLELVDAPSSGVIDTGDNGSMDIDTHLSYPTYTVEEQQELLRQYDAQHDGSFEPVSSQPVKALLKDRLYVGNLHPTVDEYVPGSLTGYSKAQERANRYALLHVFSKFGKVTKLDFLFHKAGPMKGKPRGYAFIEYGTQEVRMLSIIPFPVQDLSVIPFLAIQHLITLCSQFLFYNRTHVQNCNPGGWSPIAHHPRHPTRSC